MAKSNVSVKKILGGVAALLGLVAIIMLFVPQATAEHLESYNGLKLTFGYSKEIEIFRSLTCLPTYSCLRALYSPCLPLWVKAVNCFRL